LLSKALFFYKGDPDEQRVEFAKECWKLDKIDEAQSYLQIVENKNFYPMLNMYAKTYLSKFDLKPPMDTNDYLGAAANYCDLMEKNGITAESLYNRAEIYYRNNDLEKAAEYYERSRGYNPQDPAAYIKLRRLYLKMNDFSRALKIQIMLEQLENAPSRDAEALAALGQIFIAKGDYKKAEEFYKESIKKNPEQPEMYLQLARIYKKVNSLTNVDLIMENYSEYLKRKPNDPYVLTELGYMNYKKGNIKEASLKLQQSLNLNQNLPLTHYYIAKIYTYIFNNYVYAIKEYNRVIELNNQVKNEIVVDTVQTNITGQHDQIDMTELKFHLGYAYYYSGDYDNSLKCFSELESSIEKNTFVDSIMLTYNIANAYLLNEEFNQSLVYYKRLINVSRIQENQRINLLNNIGMTYNMMNNGDSAVTYFWKAVEMQENYLDKNKQDFVKNTSTKPKFNFKRICSPDAKIVNIKDCIEWDIFTPEKFKSAM